MQEIIADMLDKAKRDVVFAEAKVEVLTELYEKFSPNEQIALDEQLETETQSITNY